LIDADRLVGCASDKDVLVKDKGGDSLRNIRDLYEEVNAPD
jgi:hypothetical protein